MYYSQQSPGIAQKMPTHQHPAQMHDSPWTRAGHHPALGPPNHAQQPTSPAYSLFPHANGAMNAMQHHPHPHMSGPLGHHHHQNSLSHPHYQSPPNGNGLQTGLVQNGSPGNGVVTQIITPHWQNQLLKCEMIRASRSPHHRARASAMAARTVQKAAIPIQNPNAVKPSDLNGASKDTDTESNATASPSAASLAPATPSAPVAELNRPSTDHRPPQNTWSSLDMGGVNIKNIPPTSGLFTFTFLINLYLNHNALTSVPAEITKLRHLELLDLSGNNLVSVPPELGMLTSLKELYLFDNHLSNLPPELGTLHQLQTLGIEGNPIEMSLKHMIQEQGTPALIAHLRDSCPTPVPPPARQWSSIISTPEREVMQADSNTETFSLICYNILCERSATERLYGYTPSWALAWKYRRDIVMEEIKRQDTDFVCLQEVEGAQFEEYFLEALSDLGYDGIFWPKSRFKTMSDADRRHVDGCAIFFKSQKYTLVEKQLIEFNTVAMQRSDFKKTDDMFNRVLGKDHIAVVGLFEVKESGSRIILVNTHIHWDPAYRDVKLVQVALMIDEVEKIASSFAKYPPRPPAVSPTTSTANGPTAGENNSSSRPPPVYSDLMSGVYEYLSTGVVASNHPDFMSHTYGKYTSDERVRGCRRDPVPFTNFTSTFRGILDYVWFSTANLAVNAVLGEIDKPYLEKVVGFPNVHFPSDHVCIGSEFRIKPPKEAPPPRPPPVFPDSGR
ncbi:Glucose-repressible alcohol dehydrogenase transcriptional effector [Steccherinum ochraceum]|uniref:CCR4-Not complex 3'-5'-exoribonuclease subunit Ccr4 n=1 Tax=Steccherinum ochraceum TaxID=92696 RepID=A0A4R0RNA5_9APHY|nr:Glucose-repressible alcohol dehydrogenase transcriptional effector [Steccherinum ochraceum]